MCNGLQTWQSKHFKAISKILHDNDAIRKNLKYEFPGFLFLETKIGVQEISRKSKRMLSQHKFECFTSIYSWYGIAKNSLYK